ncbi:hypothetical protein [Microbacterium algeriense]|jgi:hypothetical protein|uniref:hypothetical protein n=1 Tax=Microbacterium algeriense TaxID=2615184 RepID=UPI0005AC0556|nr:hypothetical protein RU09_11975 [Microbacterium sp. MEJ108Y]
MDRDQLKALPASDRWVFVRGRIVSDSVDMDAALRGLHAALRGRDDRKALLDAPANWTEAVKKCRQLLDRYEPIDADMRGAIHSAIDAAAEAWSERNRYMHDLLDARIQGEDDPSRIAENVEPRADDDRYRFRLARQKDAPEVESVSLDDAIREVESIVAAMWRLRAARNFLAYGSWQSMLRGHVEGDWEGNASWVGSDDD